MRAVAVRHGGAGGSADAEAFGVGNRAATANHGEANEGVVLLTGEVPPAPAIVTQLHRLRSGWPAIHVLPSLTFRLRCLEAARGDLTPFAFVSDPDDEAAVARLLERAGWIAAPDLSANTLAKAVLGVEDSVPSRAVGLALRRARPLLLIESSAAGPLAHDSDRLQRLRELERRGAVLTKPERLPDDLRRALSPPQSRLYEPPPGRSPERRAVITGEDIYEAHRQGRRILEVPRGAIVTAQAVEDAARRGIELRRADEDAR